MKTFKSVMLMVLALMIFACESDDDGGSGLTNQELLVLGTWYQESSTDPDGDFTACDKNTSYIFTSTNNLNIEVFDDGSGTCESLGTINATYSLANDVDLTINLPGDPGLLATIIEISETILVVEDDQGIRITLDKTQG